MCEVKLNSKRLGVALVLEFKMKNESKRNKMNKKSEKES